MPEAEQDGYTRKEFDQHLVAIAALAVVSVAAWVAGLVLVLIHAAKGAPDVAVSNGVMAVAATSTIIAVILGQDLARRRRMKNQVASVAAECAVNINAAIAQLHEVAREVHAETIATLCTVGGEVGALRQETVEALAAVAAETEQLSAKVNAAEWASWAAKLYDQPAEAPAPAVVDIHRQRGSTQ